MKLKFPNLYEITQYMLIILKLLDVITVSWFLVFIPTYIVLGALAIILILVGLIVLIDYSKNNNTRK